MSRSRSMRPRNHQELVPRGNGGAGSYLEEFGNVHRQLMRGFGGFQDDFFGGVMKRFNDPFEDMFKFSDLHQKLHSKNTDGGFVCQTFVQSSKMGPDGKIVTEQYYDQNMGEHRRGQTISQKQQAYKNSAGVNRLAEERMLNDQGRKIVKEKRGNDIEVSNHYYNMDEHQAEEFNSRWDNANRDLGFQDKYRKYITNGGYERNNMLDIDRPMDYKKPRDQPRAIEPQPRPQSRHISDSRSQVSTHGSQATKPRNQRF